jgi:hypothetical protein
MATVALREGEAVAPAVVRRLTREALRLDAALGDPTAAARRRGRAAGVASLRPNAGAANDFEEPQ